MATNASTWFFSEPEHRAYLIEERVNHSLWANRINGAQLKCTKADPPFQMAGAWNGTPITLEWKSNDYLILSVESGYDQAEPLLLGLKEVLGANPTISYVDKSGHLFVEWRSMAAEQRVQSIQNDAKFDQIKRYK